MSDNSVIGSYGVSKASAVTDYRWERARSREALRLGVLDAAGRLLAEEGPGALSMRRVAEEVNASTQVLYTMFGGKDGLANELFLEGFGRLRLALEAVPRGDDPLRHLFSLGEAYFENGVANPNYYRAMFSDAIPGFRPPRETLEETRKTFDVLVEAVGRCMEVGLLVERDAGEVASSLWSVAHGAVSLHLLGRFGGREEARRVFGLAMRAAVGGLLRDAEARRSGAQDGTGGRAR